MEYRYFETSAVNHLMSILDIGDAIATRPYQEVRGRAWVISPVVIWEILLTSKEEDRERVLAFSQRLFHKELLPSPEEFLISYVERGCPEIENPQPLKSNGAMAEVWRELCETPEKTFVVDYNLVKQKAVAIRDLVRDLHRTTRDQEVRLIRYGPQDSIDLSLEEALHLMPSISKAEPIDSDVRTLYKIGIFYVLVLLCAQIGPDPAPVEEFWRRVGIEPTIDRLRYLLRNHEACVMRGPIAGMAHMTKLQCSAKYSRGVYFDSLHMTYLPCVSYFMAEDPDFIALRNALGVSINTLKIARPSEAEWNFQPRTNPLDQSTIRT